MKGANMKACENHTETIVIYNESACPLCKAESKFKTILEEVQKSMAIMKQIQTAAGETGAKSD
jgi:protein-disulfide isomerase